MNRFHRFLMDTDEWSFEYLMGFAALDLSLWLLPDHTLSLAVGVFIAAVVVFYLTISFIQKFPTLGWYLDDLYGIGSLGVYILTYAVVGRASGSEPAAILLGLVLATLYALDRERRDRKETTCDDES